jgi:flavorubredoxin
MSAFTCAGVGINTLNLEVMPLDEVSKAVSESAGFVIGSPTLGGHMPTQVHFSLHLAVSLTTPRSSIDRAVKGQGHTPFQAASHLHACESNQQTS